MKWLQNKMYPSLRDKKFKNDDEPYLYLTLQVASIFAAATHVFLFVLMLSCGVPYLPIINLVSVAIFLANFFVLTRRRTYLFSGLLIAVEVIIYTFLASWIIGADNYNVLYLFLVFVMQLIIPYTTGWARGILLVITIASGVVILVWGAGGRALYMLEAPFMLAISVFNLCLTAVGIALELLVGNAVKQVIVHYNAMRMQELSTQANTDPLTGLYNRRYAEMLFGKLRAGEVTEHWCVSILDIDDFKNVNDTHGHSVGDEVLCQLTAVMRQMLRKTDQIIRWGGEEFLLLLGDVDPSTARQILDKLRQAVEETEFETKAGPIRITVTLGVAPLDTARIQESITLCDESLYRGKQSGKNQVAV